MNLVREFVLLLTVVFLAAAPAARAADPIRQVIDQRVPALKDGRRMNLEDVERAILDACARRKLQATVVAPGVIKARWRRPWNSFEVVIPYTNSAYSIRYENSRRMDYDAQNQRIDGKYNEHVSVLAEHIEVDLGRALERFKSLQKPVRRGPRFNPRSAV